MRLVRTTGLAGKRTRELLSELEQRGARNTERAMPVVERIVAGVRKGGDRALRRRETRFGGPQRGRDRREPARHELRFATRRRQDAEHEPAEK